MRNLLRSVSAAAVLSLAASLTSPAAAGVKNMSLELESGIFSGIRVISENGQTWSKLKNQDLQLNGHAAIEMGIGKILAWGIFAGSCSGTGCTNSGTSLQIYAEHGNGDKDVAKDISFAVPMSKFPVSNDGGIAVTPFGNQIVAKCNAYLANGGSIHKSHSFTQTIPMTLAINTYTGRTAPSEVGSPSVTEADDQKTVNVDIPVTCEAVPEKADQVAGKQPDFNILNATLIGHPAIYRGSCPVDLLLSMKVESNIKGTFQARVEATNGGKSPFITLETSTVLPGQGTWTRSFSDKLTVPVKMLSGGGGAPVGPGAGPGGVASPTNDNEIFPGGQGGAPGDFSTGLAQNQHHGAVRLAVKNGDGFVYSDWWNYKVTCDPKKNPDVGTGPGGVSTKVDVTQAFIKVFPKATANGSQCGITVSGLVQTNVKNVNVTFALKNHQGVLSGSQTLKTSKPGNIADLLTYFDFSKSGEGVWVDQSGKWSLPGTGGNQAGRHQGSVQMVGSNPSFTSNVATYDFVCKPRAPGGLKMPPKVSVNPDLQRPGTIVVPDRPTHSRPQASGSLTGYPTISCAGGKAKRGKCLCPRPLTPVHAGANAWRCVSKDAGFGAQAKPGRLVVPRPAMICAGGRLIDGACVRGEPAPSRFGSTLPPRGPSALPPQGRQPSFQPGARMRNFR